MNRYVRVALPVAGAGIAVLAAMTAVAPAAGAATPSYDRYVIAQEGQTAASRLLPAQLLTIDASARDCRDGWLCTWSESGYHGVMWAISGQPGSLVQTPWWLVNKASSFANRSSDMHGCIYSISGSGQWRLIADLGHKDWRSTAGAADDRMDGMAFTMNDCPASPPS
jgi:hypothetical protein